MWEFYWEGVIGSGSLMGVGILLEGGGNFVGREMGSLLGGMGSLFSSYNDPSPLPNDESCNSRLMKETAGN